MSLSISGLGTALPPFSITCEQMAAFVRSFCCQNADQAELLQLLFSRSGVRRKHSVVLQGECREGLVPQDFYPASNCGRGPSTGSRMQAYEAFAPPLALAASRKALEEARVVPDEVTHLVTVSCTGFMAPGVEMALIEGLTLRPTVERNHIGFMGCHGAINGLKVARGCLATEPDAKVLMCAVELCSLHLFTEWDPEKIVANALFADGAAAVLCQNSNSAVWRLAAVGTLRIPDSAAAMTWKIGDFGFEMGLSRRIPELIARNLRGWVESWLDRQGLKLEQIGSWAVHPGGPKILDAVDLALSLPEDALAHSREVLAECGNMSSPTVLFIIDRMRRERAPRPCVALGFGPGMVVEAALFL
ncbi:MAG TPA: type III polyketide synthase [Planctomycetaceae bacterium]